MWISANSNENYRRYNFQAFANISGNFRNPNAEWLYSNITCITDWMLSFSCCLRERERERERESWRGARRSIDGEIMYLHCRITATLSCQMTLQKLPFDRQVCSILFESCEYIKTDLGCVANPRPVRKIKTGRVSQPITDAAEATGRDRSWIATRPCLRRQFIIQTTAKNFTYLSPSLIDLFVNVKRIYSIYTGLQNGNHRPKLMWVAVNRTLLWYRLFAVHAEQWYTLLTLSLPIPLRLYTVPYWSNPPFLIFDIRGSGTQDWAPERPNVKNEKWWVRPVWRWTLRT